MARHVLTLDLRDDPAVIAAYRNYHAEMWPEVARSLARAGMRNLTIHLLGRRLVMIADVDDGVDVRTVFAAHHASREPRVVEWERLMRTFQQPPPDAPPGEWWAVMEPIFDLSTRTEALARATDASS